MCSCCTHCTRQLAADADADAAAPQERALPFEGEKFIPQCQDPNKRPDLPESGLIDPEDVRLVYVILAHDEPGQVLR